MDVEGLTLREFDLEIAAVERIEAVPTILDVVCRTPAAIDRLFRPFARGAVRPGQAGLGLGLYIASQIAKAHHGTLGVSSSPEQTRFTFRMPLP